jgi:hypothetical protein
MKVVLTSIRHLESLLAVLSVVPLARRPPERRK